MNGGWSAFHDLGGEQAGIELLNTASALMRDVVGEVPDEVPIFVGPEFDYQADQLFPYRRGQGPLHVVLDTNLLIDYFRHGRALWARMQWPASTTTYVDDLEALQLIVALWVIRDVRFHVLDRFLTDARKPLSERRVSERVHTLRQFSAALTYVTDLEASSPFPGRDGLLWLPETDLERALRSIPGELDRNLVRDAVLAGVHVFLTRDERVLAAAPTLSRWSLRICSPGQLLEDLVAIGAYHCLLAPRFAYWPLPDLARVSALLRALPDAGDAA